MLLRVLNSTSDPRQVKNLMKTVLVTGGNTIIPYFNNLVVDSMATFAKEQNLKMNVVTSSPEIAAHTSWLGGSILGSLVDFDSFYISLAQIQE